MVYTKPPHAQSNFRLLVRYTFHINAATVSQKNIPVIEHLLRQGTRQIESYEEPAVIDCIVSEQMVAWHATWSRR